MEDAQKPVEDMILPLVKTNIYKLYIRRYIEKAREGDKILFITPSTFFGYYSLGADNFVQVCQALSRAKLRGVDLKLIINVHDIFTTIAAEGLLAIPLKDGTEIRHYEGNNAIYYIILRTSDGKATKVDFISDPPLTYNYLPGITSIPFNSVGHEVTVAGNAAQNMEEQFDTEWNKAKKVRDAMDKYSPVYQARQYVRFLNSLTYLLAIALGLVTGVLFVSQGQPQAKPITILIWLGGSILIGVISNLLSAFAIDRRFR